MLPGARAALNDAGANKHGARARILDAVKHERTRLLDNQPEDKPKTELGNMWARQLGTSAVVADYYAEQIVRNNGDDMRD